MTMRLSRIVDALLEINNRTTILPARLVYRSSRARPLVE
jgi:hypothetical protein